MASCELKKSTLVKRRLTEIYVGIVVCSIFFQACSIENMIGYRVGHPIQKTGKYKSLNEQQQDVLYICNVIKDSYPYFHKEVDTSVFNGIRDSIISSLEKNHTDFQFETAINRILGTLKNSHTVLPEFNPHEDTHFPFAPLWNNQGWFIRNIGTQYDSSLIGWKIIEINGYLMDKVIDRLKPFSCDENYYSINEGLKHQLTHPKYLSYLGINDNLNTLKLLLRNEQNIDTILNIEKVNNEDVIFYRHKKNSITRKKESAYSYQILNENNTCYFQFNEFIDKASALDAVKDYVSPIFRPLARRYIKRQYKKGPSEFGAYYFKDGTESFPGFLNEMFDTINKLQIKNLVIDLQYNSGGLSDLSKQLLYYIDANRVDFKNPNFDTRISHLYKIHFRREYKKLKKALYRKDRKRIPEDTILNSAILYLDKEIEFFDIIKDKNSGYYMETDIKNGFNGNIYLLCGPYTGSSGAQLAVTIKDYKMATVIGLPVADRPSGPTIATRLKLPNSKLDFSVSTVYHYRPEKEKYEEKFLVPDHWVWPTVEEYMDGGDKCLMKVFELIDNK